MIKRVIILLFVILSAATSYAYFYFHEKTHAGLAEEKISETWNLAKPDFSTLHSGDLIFRHGRGAISNALMLFSRQERKYSHAGIISIENNQAFVYHAIGGEENPSNKLRKDPLNVFCNPNDVHLFGIYHPDLTSQQLRKVDSLVKKFYKNGLEFDTQFDLNSDDKMYCSEFVYKVLLQATGDKNYIHLSSYTGFQYVACDDLYLNRHCMLLSFYRY